MSLHPLSVLIDMLSIDMVLRIRAALNNLAVGGLTLGFGSGSLKRLGFLSPLGILVSQVKPVAFIPNFGLFLVACYPSSPGKSGILKRHPNDIYKVTF